MDNQFTCFVEGCERKCLTWQKRRMHLIDKHMYPKNFFFAITKDGIDGRRTLLNEDGHRRRRSSTAAAAAAAAAQTSGHKYRASRSETGQNQTKDTPQPQPKTECSSESSVTSSSPKPKNESANEPRDTDMSDLTGAMSSLSFVPPSVRFGRGRPGFAKK
jgi:uncharacterized protein YdaU (DUF1376 family)